MFDNDNDFSIENILKAAQSGQADGKKTKPDKIRPITANHAHKAPHALTPEEVLHFSEPQKQSKPLPDFDAISKSLNFVVFENDIDPDKTETPQIDFGKRLEKEDKKPAPAPKVEKAVEPAKPIKVEPAPAPAPTADVKPSVQSGGTLYERMKRMRAEQATPAPASAKPIRETPAPAVPIEEKPVTPIEAKPAPAKIVEEKPAPIHVENDTKAQLPDIKEPTPSTPPASIPMTPMPPRRTGVSRSVEEIIASAEKLAASKVKTMYAGSVEPKAAKTEEEVRFAPLPRRPIAVEQNTVKTEATRPADEPKPTPIVPPVEKSEPKDISSVSDATAPRQSVKVTPVKRSRVFTTPIGGGVTTPATKVVTGEIPVKVDVIDRSIATPAEDHRIKEHNPYASQYSLADADLAGQGQRFATRPIELTGDKKDIISSAASGSTIQFDPVKIIEDEVPDIAAADEPKREEWEDDLEVERRKKASQFKLFGGAEPDNAPDEMAPDAPQEATEPDEQISELDDYETIDDAKSVLSHLNGKLAHITTRLTATLVITVLLFVLATPLCAPIRTANGILFGVVNLLLLLLAAVINLPIMKGLVSLVTLRPDTDSPAALSVIGTLIQTLFVCIADSEGILLTALGALALTFNLFGKLTTLSTVKANFRMIADEETKKSVVLIDDPQIAAPIAGGAVLGEAFIVAGRRIKNATAFLFNSFSPDPYEKPLGKILLVTLLAAVGGGVYGFILQGIELALILFAAILALGCPITSALLSALPMKFASKRLNRLGAELTDFASAKEMGYVNALALEASDLFPKGTVNLYNMHILAPNPIDRSILEAAAIASQAGSPLAPIFTAMNHEGAPLPEVDTIKFEDKMGLSGWIGEKRIFIGNRTLMTAHNVAGLPSLDIDKRILKSGYFPIYLATTEGPCALFIVGYEADEEISHQLRRLTDEGVTLLIDSCDQNLSEEMICDYFELHPDLVKVMPKPAADLYKQQVIPADSEPSFAVCKSDAAGMAALVTAALRLGRVYRVSLILHILLLIAGFAMVFAAAHAGLAASITALTLGVYQLITGLLTLLIPLIYRP